MSAGTAHNKEDMSQPIHNWPISGFPGDSVAFYFQSEVYRRNDGTFLHGARTPGPAGELPRTIWVASFSR